MPGMPMLPGGPRGPEEPGGPTLPGSPYKVRQEKVNLTLCHPHYALVVFRISFWNFSVVMEMLGCSTSTSE